MEKHGGFLQGLWTRRVFRSPASLCTDPQVNLHTSPFPTLLLTARLFQLCEIDTPTGNPSVIHSRGAPPPPRCQSDNSNSDVERNQ